MIISSWKFCQRCILTTKKTPLNFRSHPGSIHFHQHPAMPLQAVSHKKKATDHTFMKIIPDIDLWKRKFLSNFVSHLDSKDFCQGTAMAPLDNIRTAAFIFMKSVPQMIFLGKRKSPLNFGSHPKSTDRCHGPAITHLINWLDKCLRSLLQISHYWCWFTIIVQVPYTLVEICALLMVLACILYLQVLKSQMQKFCALLCSSYPSSFL